MNKSIETQEKELLDAYMSRQEFKDGFLYGIMYFLLTLTIAGIVIAILHLMGV